MRTGNCQQCGFAGVLKHKAVIPKASTIEIEKDLADPSKPLDDLLVCVTCFETPAGCVSENVSYRK